MVRPEVGTEWLTRFSTGPLVVDSEVVCPQNRTLPRVAARWSFKEFGGARELTLRGKTYIFSLEKVLPFRRSRDSWIAVNEEVQTRYIEDIEAEEGRLTATSNEFYLE